MTQVGCCFESRDSRRSDVSRTFLLLLSRALENLSSHISVEINHINRHSIETLSHLSVVQLPADFHNVRLDLFDQLIPSTTALFLKSFCHYIISGSVWFHHKRFVPAHLELKIHVQLAWTVFQDNLVKVPARPVNNSKSETRSLHSDLV